MKQAIIKWTLITVMLAGIITVTTRGIMRQYNHYQMSRNPEITDSVKQARSIEILHKWHRTGYIDTTGTGQGVNTLDTNRY